MPKTFCFKTNVYLKPKVICSNDPKLLHYDCHTSILIPNVSAAKARLSKQLYNFQNILLQKNDAYSTPKSFCNEKIYDCSIAVLCPKLSALNTKIESISTKLKTFCYWRVTKCFQEHFTESQNFSTLKIPAFHFRAQIFCFGETRFRAVLQRSKVSATKVLQFKDVYSTPKSFCHKKVILQSSKK